MSSDKRIFKASQVDAAHTGWIADLSGEHEVNPDMYWRFRTRKAAAAFLALVDGGEDPRQAAERVTRPNVAGTPPDTSLHLGDERRAWLAEQGGIQPTIHRLVDREMGKD